MGMYEGRGQLTKSMKDLMQRWMDARANWDDAMARKFEEQHILPLQQDFKNAVSAMDHMGVVLQQIHRDCE